MVILPDLIKNLSFRHDKICSFTKITAINNIMPVSLAFVVVALLLGKKGKHWHPSPSTTKLPLLHQHHHSGKLLLSPMMAFYC